MASPINEFDRTVRILQKCAFVGGVVLIAGVAFAPERIWSNLLVAAYYLVTLALGGALFMALAYVCGASWNVGFRRIPEAMAGALPFAGLVMLAVLLVRADQYGWQSDGEHGPGTFWFKQAWTSPPYWAARAVVYVALWVLLSRLMISLSRRQDHAGSVALTVANKRLSAVFLVVYAVTFSLASCDWLMLLEPMWFSTVWGVYNFAGMMQATLAAMIVLALWLRGGPLRHAFTDDHLHDLGKLLLGFSCFWMYIWYSQYMLIWYTNIPEETAYFIPRTHGPWGPITVVSIVLNWIVPFFVLLPRPCKRNGSIIMKVAVVVLIGRWVDLYLIVFPATIGATPVFGLWELAAAGCLVGSFGWLFCHSFFAAAPVPHRDPLLGESLHYHC